MASRLKQMTLLISWGPAPGLEVQQEIEPFVNLVIQSLKVHFHLVGGVGSIPPPSPNTALQPSDKHQNNRENNIHPPTTATTGWFNIPEPPRRPRDGADQRGVHFDDVKLKNERHRRGENNISKRPIVLLLLLPLLLLLLLQDTKVKPEADTGSESLQEY